MYTAGIHRALALIHDEKHNLDANRFLNLRMRKKELVIAGRSTTCGCGQLLFGERTNFIGDGIRWIGGLGL